MSEKYRKRYSLTLYRGDSPLGVQYDLGVRYGTSLDKVEALLCQSSRDDAFDGVSRAELVIGDAMIRRYVRTRDDDWVIVGGP